VLSSFSPGTLTLAPRPRLNPPTPPLHDTEYRTVAGVSGPLVVVECVKK